MLPLAEEEARLSRGETLKGEEVPPGVRWGARMWLCVVRHLRAEGRGWSWKPIAPRIMQTTLDNPPPSIIITGWAAVPLPPQLRWRDSGPNRMLCGEREAGHPYT